eukprot:1644908-Rhodomonas_salina.1
MERDSKTEWCQREVLHKDPARIRLRLPSSSSTMLCSPESHAGQLTPSPLAMPAKLSTPASPLKQSESRRASSLHSPIPGLALVHTVQLSPKSITQGCLHELQSFWKLGKLCSVALQGFR